MNYEEWLENIEKLTNINDKELLSILEQTNKNDNIDHLLEPKLIELIKLKINKAIKKIIRDIETIYNDVNYLDLTLVNFKKEIAFIERIINLKQISQEENIQLYNLLKEETEHVYDILIKEANSIDQTGILSMTVKNNRIKWKEV